MIFQHYLNFFQLDNLMFNGVLIFFSIKKKSKKISLNKRNKITIDVYINY